MPPADSGHPPRLRAAALCAVYLALGQSGCINSMVMAGKMLFGDTRVMSAFEQRTGVSLCKGDQQVALVCTAPPSALPEFGSFQVELQDEALLQLKMRGVQVLPTSQVATALGDSGGGFDRDAFARLLPGVNYIIHLDVERFSHTEPASPNLLRGRASGVAYAYEVHRADSDASRPRVVQVFFQEFDAEYPASHPVSTDQTSQRVFHRRFVEHLAKAVSRIFCDVPTQEAYL